jgi:hypothetical protein
MNVLPPTVQFESWQQLVAWIWTTVTELPGPTASASGHLQMGGDTPVIIFKRPASGAFQKSEVGLSLFDVAMCLD